MLKEIITISFFVFTTLTSLGQVFVTITNQEINESGGFTLVFETDSSLYKNEQIQKTNNFVVDTSKFKKLTISHIGYFDTTINAKDLKEFNNIALRANYKLLETVEVRKLEEFIYSDLKAKGSKRLSHGGLSIDYVWHFTINLPENTKKLKKFKLLFKNLSKNDTINFNLYNNETAALNRDSFFSNSIIIHDNKTNLVDVLSGTTKNLDVENSFIISVSVRKNNKNQPSSVMIICKFKSEETQFYYQSRKNELYKYPMKTYFGISGGYPHLLSEITYFK